LHFVASVDVPGALCHNDTVREELAGFGFAADAREELAILEVGGDVGGMIVDQVLEIGDGGLIVAELRTFHGEAVAGEGIRGTRGDELLENFTARLLRLGHFVRARIIAGAPRTRKAVENRAVS
jgi:hypothetical protein